MSAKPFTLTLHRDGISTPWGFRMAGGCDLDSPLVVTKVSVGSPSEGELHPGDIIRKVGLYDARDLRHQDALNLFKNAGGSINLVIQREVVSNGNCSSRCSSSLSFNAQPPVAGGVATPFTVAGLPTYERAQQSPVNNLCRFPPALIDSSGYSNESTGSPSWQSGDEETFSITQQMMMPHTTMKKVYGGCDPENTLLWPYRTSPLVLPGAKVKKDPPPNISYLRHHPNPMMRAAPGQYELVPEEIVQKQKVADTAIRRAIGNVDVNGTKKVISRPYNSPIGLYSEQNIVNSIQSQASGLTPNGNANAYSPNSPRFRKTVVYDPSKSETYRALHESELGEKVEEVNTPVTPKVFNAPKSPTRRLNAPQYNTHRASPQPHPTVPHPNADYGVHTDEIHQSNSFKRLMTMVRNDY